MSRDDRGMSRESGQRVSFFLRECQDVEGRRKGASTSAQDARRVLFPSYLVESFGCVCVDRGCLVVWRDRLNSRRIYVGLFARDRMWQG